MQEMNVISWSQPNKAYLTGSFKVELCVDTALFERNNLID